jgi:hypothetical protein
MLLFKKYSGYTVTPAKSGEKEVSCDLLVQGMSNSTGD